MKAALTTLSLLCAMTAAAQVSTTAPPTVDLHLAGQHIEKAGKMRNTAILTAIGMGLVGGAAAASMDADQRAGAYAMIGVGFVAYLAINIGSNGHERKAGRIMQGR